MSRRCVRRCQEGGTLFTFPLENDMSRRLAWMRLLGVNANTEVKYLYACHRHFSARHRNRRNLSRGAVPDMNLCAPTAIETGQYSLMDHLQHNEQMTPSGFGDLTIAECTRNLEVPPRSIAEGLSVEISEAHVPEDQTVSSGYTELRVHNQETQTEAYLSEDSPRKRKYREEIDALKRELANKDIVIASMTQSLPVQQQIEEICRNIPPHLAICVRNCMANYDRPPSGRRFDSILKTIVLGVRFTSPQAYRYLRPLFHWPSPSTLSTFIKNWPRNPGCCLSSIKSLELRSRGFTKEQKFISLCCDEMSLKTHLKYDKNRDFIIGLEDYGDENRTSRTANSVLCLMAQGIGGAYWSQPIAYFFVHGSCKGAILRKYVFEVITQLQGIGLFTCQLVCDQGSNFVSFARLIGVTENRPYFEVNGEKVVFFFDSPHLLKSARNCIENNKNNVSFRGHPVNWADIVHFHEQDSLRGIRCAPKLTTAHLKPTSLQKMSVSLAAQVLSNTVASAMLSLYSTGNLNSSQSPSFLNTAEFALFFDQLFNIFNSRATDVLRRYGQPFSSSLEQLNFLEEAERTLRSITVHDSTGRDITNNFSYIKGWLLNIQSLKYLWLILSRNDFEFIRTRRLCQDELEHYFGQIRRGGGLNPRTTPSMFSDLFRQSWGLRHVNFVTSGNCESLPSAEWELFSLRTLERVCNDPLVQDTSWQTFQSLPRPNLYNIQNVVDVDVVESDFLQRNSFAYFCGYIYYQYFNLHHCLEPLPRFEEGEIPQDAFTFTKEKEYDTSKLVKAPPGFINFLSKLEEVLNENFDSCCHLIGFSKALFDKMVDIEPFRCCANSNPDILKRLFIRIRTYFSLKIFNKEACTPEFKYTKFLCLAHR